MKELNDYYAQVSTMDESYDEHDEYSDYDEYTVYADYTIYTDYTDHMR